MLSTAENMMAIGNEVFVSLYLYTLMALTSGVEDVGEASNVQRDNCGLALIAIVFSSTFFNVAKLLWVFLTMVNQRFKQFRERRAAAR
jgi:hypothetical protein